MCRGYIKFCIIRDFAKKSGRNLRLRPDNYQFSNKLINSNLYHLHQEIILLPFLCKDVVVIKQIG